MQSLTTSNWLIQIKRLAAICLLAAFFLPLTQCTQATPRDAASSSGQQSQTTPVSTTQVFASTADKNDPLTNAANVLLFVWPVCLMLLTLLRPQCDEHFALRHLELALCLFSIVLLLRLTAFGNLLPGGYLAWGALSTYTLITLLRLLSRIRQVWDR